jgi:hypothetical protein
MGDRNFLDGAKIEGNDERFLELLEFTMSKIPKNVPPLESVKRLSLRKRSRKEGLVGLTTYCDVKDDGKAHGRQRISFYEDLLQQLSDAAAVAVLAHEIAHAWLNEHKHPEESLGREKEADELARKWGFGPELDALDSEADTINS